MFQTTNQIVFRTISEPSEGSILVDTGATSAPILSPSPLGWAVLKQPEWPGFFPTYSALGGWEIPNSWVDIDRYPPEHSHKYHKFGPSRHAGPKFIAFPQTSSTFPRPQLNRLENSTQVTRLRILSQLQRSESQRLNYPPIIKHGNGNQW